MRIKHIIPVAALVMSCFISPAYCDPALTVDTVRNAVTVNGTLDGYGAARAINESSKDNFLNQIANMSWQKMEWPTSTMSRAANGRLLINDYNKYKGGGLHTLNDDLSVSRKINTSLENNVPGYVYMGGDTYVRFPYQLNIWKMTSNGWCTVEDITNTFYGTKGFTKVSEAVTDDRGVTSVVAWDSNPPGSTKRLIITTTNRMTTFSTNVFDSPQSATPGYATPKRMTYLGKNRLMIPAGVGKATTYIISDDYFNSYYTNISSVVSFAESCGYNSAVRIGTVSNTANLIVERTSDAGDTWEIIHNTTNTCIHSGPVTYIGNNQLVFLGTPDNANIHLYYSMDGGYIWGNQYVLPTPSVSLASWENDAYKLFFTGKALTFNLNDMGSISSDPAAGIYYLRLNSIGDLNVGNNANLLILSPQSFTPIAVQGGVYNDGLGTMYRCTNGTTWSSW